MTRIHELSRRRFLWELGNGVVVVAAFGAALACGNDDGGPGGATGATDTSEPGTDTKPAGDSAALTWKRANLGRVSAYVLVRGREAAVVDTGETGGEAEIGKTLTAAGSGWADVRHVIVTHKHPDHQGGLGAVLAAATKATAWAGEADIPEIESPRPLKVAADGADIFGLRVVATPGHTPGHICVLDTGAGLLITGDAVAVRPEEGVVGPNPQFSEDMTAAHASVKKLSQLEFDTLLVGHGDPIEGGARAKLAALAATLGS